MVREFKINNFDLLRLFAALEVVLLHSFPHLHLPYPAFLRVILNFPGITMFFVMSGFLISASLERNHDIVVYFKNRAFRIFPALWTCIVLTIIVIALVTNISFFNIKAVYWFFAQLVGLIYTPEFLKGFGFRSYNGSLWTIPLELQFYVVLPILYFIVNRVSSKQSIRTVIIIISCALFCFITYFLKVHYDADNFNYNNIPKPLRYSFIPNIYLFLFGVVLQRLEIYKSKWVYGKGAFWLMAYLCVSYLVPTSNTTYIFKLLCLGVTTISLAYTLPTLSNKIFKGNDISYGVYIYHGLVLGVIVQFQLFGNALYIPVILATTIALATLSWVFIEKPIMKSKKKTIHHLKTIENT
ncbi:acyltransferase family protein [Mucilaginibacter glaciei]|uniref:Acyltransferase n=1 Tax=Mucilaginibacter glaciei TaxID=2772109 RepID=A0A926S2Y1_9SPHI|nr:acyltransferase [Mucilaginibacter glaciei]MBD1394643.1 acyltransferase [Mucilaginibacter glaciei]